MMDAGKLAGVLNDMVEEIGKKNLSLMEGLVMEKVKKSAKEYANGLQDGSITPEELLAYCVGISLSVTGGVEVSRELQARTEP
jgi:hypothetical protein